MTDELDESTSTPGLRKHAIADAAIEIISREGLRSLTHRAVDRELGLAIGSTSYYVRTRRQLLELVVHRLAGRTEASLQEAEAKLAREIQHGPGIPEMALVLATLVQAIAAHPTDQLARLALAIDLHADDELHPLLTSSSPIRSSLMRGARAMVSAAGAADPDGAARGLLVIADGLVFDRLAGSGVDPDLRADATEVFASYLHGISRDSGGAVQP